MRIGLAIAPEHALPTAFVVFRDKLATSIEKAARLGYDAIELALADAHEVQEEQITHLLEEHNMHLAAISTGRVFAEKRIAMTHPDAAIRRQTVDVVKGLIDLAAPFKSRVTFGRSRGSIPESEPRSRGEDRFIDCIRECADYAAVRGVEIMIEPVNRYEINFINNVPEAIELVKKINRPNVKVMPDVFHMNIEDVSITGSLEQAGKLLGYIHFADSNRWAPGQGHLDFPAIVGSLRKIGYEGYVTVEILPYPDPDTAAQQAITYLRTLIPKNE